MRQARYLLLDVFTDVPFAGNQLAVFPDATLDDATMQRIARELNLAESVFLERGDGEAAAKLRIFTPGREIRFAGHPTIGTSIALIDHLRWLSDNVTHFTLSLRVGNIPIRLERERNRTIAWLTTPAVEFGETFAQSAAAAVLHLETGDVRDDLPPQMASAGNPFLFVGLHTPEAVDRASYDEAAFRRLGVTSDIVGVYFFAQTANGAYARMFAPMSGIAEDPATGSATGPLYAYLANYGALPHAARFTNEQGVAMGRRSVLHVQVGWQNGSLSQIEVGGQAVLVGEGAINLA